MKLEVPYKEVLFLSNQIIKEFVDCIEDNDFLKDNRRQKMKSLETTPSILLRHSEGYIEQLLGNTSYNKSFGLTDFPLIKKYKTPLNKIITELKKEYIFTDYACVIAKLIPNSEVGRHKDSGAFLEQCHRIHVPLISDAECIYEVDGIKWHMEVGKVYEIDNTRPHSCMSGSKPRTHLIINLYPKGLNT